MRALATIIAAVLLLAGCGTNKAVEGGPAAAPSTVTIKPTPTGPPGAKQYGTVEQLRDAAVGWGMTCDKWDGTGATDLSAAQSGVCSPTVGDASVLFATYATPADLQTDLTYLRGLIFPGEDVALLVGPNWLVSTDGAWAARLQAKLGGTIAK